MKKKKIKLVVASMTVAAILVGGTLAWFQFHQNVPNHFTTGSVKTDIQEKFDPKAPEVTNMQPGVKIDKKVSVANIGHSQAFIRVKLSSVWDKKGEAIQKYMLGDNVVAGSPKEAQVDLNLSSTWASNWIYNPGDGYFYYKKVVPAVGTLQERSTSELLDTVSLDKDFDLTSDYQDQGLTVNVTSDAIQTTNGAWQDAWNKDGKLSKEVQDTLTKLQTTNTSTTTNEITGSTATGGQSSDHQKPLAK